MVYKSGFIPPGQGETGGSPKEWNEKDPERLKQAMINKRRALTQAQEYMNECKLLGKTPVSADPLRTEILNFIRDEAIKAGKMTGEKLAASDKIIFEHEQMLEALEELPAFKDSDFSLEKVEKAIFDRLAEINMALAQWQKHLSEIK